MKKSRVLLFLSIVIMLWSTTHVFAASALVVKIDGKQVMFTSETGTPYVDSKKMVWVPFQSLMESFGATTKYDGKQKTAFADKDGKNVQIPVGRDYFFVNGIKTNMEAPAKLVNGRLYIPVNKIVEALNGDVVRQSQSGIVQVNTYTKNHLEAFIKNTPCDQDIKAFRDKVNTRRNNLSKASYKYFDVYYPNTDEAKLYVDEIGKYADLSYMFLSKIYGGKQVPIEIHLIKESDASGLDEGKIRQEEHITYVYMNSDHTTYKAGIIHELVHEMNHNFFSSINGIWRSSTIPYGSFIDEGISRNIGDIFLEKIVKNNDKKYYRFPIAKEFKSYNNDLLRRKKTLNYYPTLNEISQDIGNWSFSSDKEIIRIDSVIFFWYYIYEQYGINAYENIVRNIGNKNYEDKFKEIMGEELNQVYTNYSSY